MGYRPGHKPKPKPKPKPVKVVDIDIDIDIDVDQSNEVNGKIVIAKEIEQTNKVEISIG